MSQPREASAPPPPHMPKWKQLSQPLNQGVDGSFDSVKLGPGEYTKLQLLQNWLQALTLCCRVVNFSVLQHPFICCMSNLRLQHMHFFHYFIPNSPLLAFFHEGWLFNYSSLHLFMVVGFFFVPSRSLFSSKCFFDSFISCTSGCALSRLIEE